MRLPPIDISLEPDFNDRLQAAIARLDDGTATSADLVLLRRFARRHKKKGKDADDEREKESERAREALRARIRQANDEAALSLIEGYHL